MLLKINKTEACYILHCKCMIISHLLKSLTIFKYDNVCQNEHYILYFNMLTNKSSTACSEVTQAQ